MTKKTGYDIHINMPTKKPPSFESLLRELVNKKGLRKTARDLNIAPESLYRSLMDGSNIKLERIKRLLDYFGYELNISKRKEVKKLTRRNYRPYPTSDYLIKSKSQDRERR